MSIHNICLHGEIRKKYLPSYYQLQNMLSSENKTLVRVCKEISEIYIFTLNI